MGFLEGLGAAIGSLSPQHTTRYVVIDQHGHKYASEGISPEDALDSAIRKTRKIDPNRSYVVKRQ